MKDAEETTEARGVVLAHFANYRFTSGFWDADASTRQERALAWFRGQEAAADIAHLYILQGLESGGDVLVWSAVRIEDTTTAGRYFTARATAENRHRGIIEPVNLLWGLTRPSEYSKARSVQEIDPFAPARKPYLVAYPFTKTADWYLLGRETRQGMMNEHIRIGKGFRQITQLLLYSFGLQDQEFVVVYEMDDLALFSQLVYDLRDTEARRYTKSDAPLHTGILVEPEAWVETLG